MEVRELSANHLRTSYKQTEIGVLPTDWRIAEIGQLAETSSGTTPPRSQYDRYFKGGVYAWVKTLDLNNAEILETDESVTDKAVEETSLRLFPEGSVLVAMYGGLRQIGRTGLLRLPAAVNQAITAIRPNPTVFCPEFLLFYLNHRVGHWQSVASSSRKDPNITGADVRAFKLPLPEIGEQQKVAAALTDANALIDSLEQLLIKKRQVKQGAMQELLTGKRRLPGFEQPWATFRLGEISTITMGRTPARLIGSYWGSGNKWLSIADLKGKVVATSKEEITDAGAQGMEEIPEGTLLMSFKLTIGRLAFAGCNLYTNEAICALRSPKVDKELLYYALSRVDFSLFGKQAVKGYTLNRDSLHNVEVTLPSDPEEQRAVAHVLSDLDMEITALESRLTKARSLKQAMAQALLTGRIRLVESTT